MYDVKGYFYTTYTLYFINIFIVTEKNMYTYHIYKIR